jgi:hypothetical protein
MEQLRKDCGPAGAGGVTNLHSGPGGFIPPTGCTSTVFLMVEGLQVAGRVKCGEGDMVDIPNGSPLLSGVLWGCLNAIIKSKEVNNIGRNLLKLLFCFLEVNGCRRQLNNVVKGKNRSNSTL